MSIDVSKFQQTFFDETHEGLDQMESGLLELEHDAVNDEAISSIFRAAHSIKGGAGMLGFTQMADFTHLVETILDRRRSDRAKVTQEVITVLLDSVDLLRAMLAFLRDDADLDADRVAEVEGRLRVIVEMESGLDRTAGPEEDGGDDGVGGWRIEFAPLPTLFRTGNDPVRIFGELFDLGPCSVTARVDAVPPLENLDVEICHISWTAELSTPPDGDPIPRSAVDEVFEWVVDDAELTINEIAPDGGGRTGATSVTVERPANDRRNRGQGHKSSIRVDIEKVDTLINMVGELVITQSMLQQAARAGEHFDQDKLREGLAELEANTRELQGSVMHIRMLPIGQSFSRLPRLVRDLATGLGKQIDLAIHGETTELDKTVMEKIGDPLLHLIRNSVDHGIETPEKRVAAGKSETGTVTVGAFHEGGNIIIEIADDGAGLPVDVIEAKARERGLIGPDEHPTERQIQELIFHPGFSTAEVVSDISGRGVGMDVVKRNITDLGGVIDIISKQGSGTTFRIRLPLTLAILDGQLVRVGDQVFVIPLVSIVESLLLDRSRIGSLARDVDVYHHRGSTIPLVNLHETMETAADHQGETRPLLVVVETENTRAGLMVDELLGQQQIVIKSLTTNFRAVPGLSGATILGDGTVALILDVNSVVTLFRSTPARPAPVLVAAAETRAPAAGAASAPTEHTE